LAGDNSIPVAERNVSLAEVYSADEVFTTGTMGGLAPVLEVDGRRIGTGERGPLTLRLQGLHAAWSREHGEPLPFCCCDRLAGARRDFTPSRKVAKRFPVIMLSPRNRCILAV
jgi:hypothetical protein